MGILDKWLHSDDYNVKQLTEAINVLEKEFRKQCDELQAYDAEMKRCIEASRACAPDSSEYRINERKFINAKKGRILKKQEAENTNKKLENYVSALQVLQHKIAMGKGSKTPSIIKPDELALIIEQINKYQQTLNDESEVIQDTVDSVYKETDDETRTDSEFARLVAAGQRRQDTMELSGLDIPKKEENFNPRSEFDRLVNDTNPKD